MPAPEGIQGKPAFLHLSYFREAKSVNVKIVVPFGGAKSVNVAIFAKRGVKKCECQNCRTSFFRIIIKV